MAYSFFWNEFPSTLADIKDALPLALDIYRGKDVARDDAAKAVFNCAGFAYNASLGENPDDPPIFGATSASKPDVEAAFAEAIAASKNPATMAAPPVGSAWLTILIPVLMDLFKRWLDRRS